MKFTTCKYFVTKKLDFLSERAKSDCLQVVETGTADVRDGTYTLNGTSSSLPVFCSDECVYTKDGASPHDFYCFGAGDIDSTCQVEGKTVVRSVQSIFPGSRHRPPSTRGSPAGWRGDPRGGRRGGPTRGVLLQQQAGQHQPTSPVRGDHLRPDGGQTHQAGPVSGPGTSQH